MTFEELKSEAKAQGYNLIPIRKFEKLLPCTCGFNRRERWECLVCGQWVIELRCKNCGKSVQGRNEADARRNWNRMMKGEQNEKKE